jgi:hypothetical protein
MKSPSESRGEHSPAEFARGIRWDGLPVGLWWPNLEGEQPLYAVTCRLVDARGVYNVAGDGVLSLRFEGPRVYLSGASEASLRVYDCTATRAGGRIVFAR